MDVQIQHGLLFVPGQSVQHPMHPHSVQQHQQMEQRFVRDLIPALSQEQEVQAVQQDHPMNISIVSTEE